ncbi:SanA/YdcF family protein [Cellulomonas gelida]|uniref:Membrane protein n=1 Tax=Cellulomonas gelida TaxID=1712 RepID=A0A4Y3KS57_9CELL|nr:ElyC/SanA/YdcF family protein [Cellulomonas gelida]GEA85770.1 membrane protein [Cellulomonas gelida]GGL33427.1 membrane protein [Cellulomonas gelida]
MSIDADARTDEGTPPATPAAVPRRARRRWRRRLGIAAALVVLLLVPLAWVQGAGQARLRTQETVQDAPVALVFGAGLRPDGSPSTYLRRRLDAAQTLYESGKVQVILVSGDSGSIGHDEPTAMHDYLVAAGVPTGAVVLDYAGFDTHDTCVRAHRVFGVDAAVVLTQDYHVRRAVFSCSAAGIDTQGIGVSSASVRPEQLTQWRLREVPASYKAWWDGLTGRDPVYLGPAETGVQDALRDS